MRMNKIIIMSIYLLIYSMNIVVLKAMDTEIPAYQKIDVIINNGERPKKSCVGFCLKKGFFPVLYLGTLGLVAYAGYHYGNEMNKACHDCSTKLEDVSDIYTMVENCTAMIGTTLKQCPDAADTCMQAIAKCWYDGN